MPGVLLLGGLAITGITAAAVVVLLAIGLGLWWLAVQHDNQVLAQALSDDQWYAQLDGQGGDASQYGRLQLTPSSVVFCPDGSSDAAWDLSRDQLDAELAYLPLGAGVRLVTPTRTVQLRLSREPLGTRRRLSSTRRLRDLGYVTDFVRRF